MEGPIWNVKLQFVSKLFSSAIQPCPKTETEQPNNKRNINAPPLKTLHQAQLIIKNLQVEVINISNILQKI